MGSLSSAQITHIVTLLDQGKSDHQIPHITGISTGSISKIRSSQSDTLSKFIGGRPCKLSPSDIHYAVRLITQGTQEGWNEACSQEETPIPLSEA